MKEIVIDTNWTFDELLQNIESIKSQVWEIIGSFSCFDLKKRSRF